MHQKNILVFSDGTGQEGGRGRNSNIYKMFNMVEDRTPHQVAFYDRGVGTGLGAFTGMVGGLGFARNVRDCYTFIFEHFQSHDRIFLFGFSRGAATVRSLAYFIHLFGILPHSRPELIGQAWRIYQTRDHERREERARAFIARHHTMWANVHFLGCYDTVAALGLPFTVGSLLLDNLPGFRHRFHTFDLSPAVVHARHALSIDDARRTFHPVLWNRPPEDARRTSKQVWFAGAHTDVGGGYPDAGLSDISLVWMTQEAHARGLRIYPRHTESIEENPRGMLTDSRGKGWTRLYRRLVRSWPQDRTDAPRLHASVPARCGEVEGYEPWILGLECEEEPWVPLADQPWYHAEDPGPKAAP